MTDLRLLADMNLSPKTVAALRLHGYEIIRVSQLLPTNASDLAILDLAQQENRVVVTQDLDFSMLLALRRHSRPSLITLRLSLSNPEVITEALLRVLPRIEQMLLEGCAATIEDHSVRVRTLPIG
jgi:predicted nuclease of predicted toxin-antitoxin system